MWNPESRAFQRKYTASGNNKRDATFGVPNLDAQHHFWGWRREEVGGNELISYFTHFIYLLSSYYMTGSVPGEGNTIVHDSQK